MRTVVALQEQGPEQKPAVFLAGGISGCGDWQSEMTALLSSTTLTLLNPRRPDFPMDDPKAAHAQIDWEFRHLRNADAALFWFPRETLCPITLFELGAWSRSDKPLFVGTHSQYQRRLDVIIQLSLARPEVVVTEDLATLAAQVQGWASRNK